jgi:hypothetical protein
MAKATKKKESDLRTPEEASKLFYAMLKASVTVPLKKRKKNKTSNK